MKQDAGHNRTQIPDGLGLLAYDIEQVLTNHAGNYTGGNEDQRADAEDHNRSHRSGNQSNDHIEHQRGSCHLILDMRRRRHSQLICNGTHPYLLLSTIIFLASRLTDTRFLLAGQT